MKKIKNFSEEPVVVDWDALCETENFKKFLKSIFNFSDTICLTFNKSYEKFLNSEWSFLEDSLIYYERTNESAVTRGGWFTLLYFAIDRTIKDWLLEKTGIDDFGSSEYRKMRLEDLCFAKDGEIVFASCTHERFCDMSEELANYVETK